MNKVAIIGGGPGGLITAWNLQQRLPPNCELTLFESSGRLGGKIQTGSFDHAEAIYEIGLAEFYDYSMIGDDPLRNLIDELGLQTVPMDSSTVQFEGMLLEGAHEMRHQLGSATCNAINSFRDLCIKQISPEEYYEGCIEWDNKHEWARISCEDLLDREVKDDRAKRFIKVMARSDIATEYHKTSGLNALKNFVMDVSGYMELYCIKGGNERLIGRLCSELDSTIKLNHRIVSVDKDSHDRYWLEIMTGDELVREQFDYVVICLPHSWLGTIDWKNEGLRQAMVRHISYFDRPAHYLRVATLFREPFWGKRIPGSWFMSDRFGGCCVYVENARYNVGPYGVLNWLIAGSDALAICNLSDQEIVEAALKSLPQSLSTATDHFLEGKVHRWLSSVNSEPGGIPARRAVENHRPEPRHHPSLFVVGDYLYDATLNGAMESSLEVTEMLASEVIEKSKHDRCCGLAHQPKNQTKRKAESFG